MYIGIDLGTTGCKVVMFSPQGEILCEYNQEYELIFQGTYVEQDANLWWSLVQDGIWNVVSTTGLSDITAISVSTQGISFVPVDRKGTPLSNAISWLDMRAGEMAERLKEAFGPEKIYEKTGIECEADYSLPKLMWLLENEAEIYARADKILFPLDFLNLKLCGRAVCDYTIAGGTMLYNIREKCWDRDLLDFSGIAPEKLPDVACMGTPIGMLLPEVAEYCGIHPGCQVILGGQDQKLAAIGAGIRPGVCTVSFGTATAISKLSDGTLPYDKHAALFPFEENTYISEFSLSTTGAALRWLVKTMCPDKSYKEIDQLALLSGPGAGGVTFETDLATGGTLSGLTLSTTLPDIIYALFEGVSRDICDGVQRLGGAEELLVFGGGAKSDIWCKILSRICQMPVSILDTPETAALGAAILASGKRMLGAGVKKQIHCTEGAD